MAKVCFGEDDGEEFMALVCGADGGERIRSMRVEERERVWLELSGGGALAEHRPAGKIETDVERIGDARKILGPFEGFGRMDRVPSDLESIMIGGTEEVGGNGLGGLRLRNAGHKCN